MSVNDPETTRRYGADMADLFSDYPFALAWDDGRELTLERAIAYALIDVPPAP